MILMEPWVETIVSGTICGQLPARHIGIPAVEDPDVSHALYLSRYLVDGLYRLYSVTKAPKRAAVSAYGLVFRSEFEGFSYGAEGLCVVGSFWRENKDVTKSVIEHWNNPSMSMPPEMRDWIVSQVSERSTANSIHAARGFNDGDIAVSRGRTDRPSLRRVVLMSVEQLEQMTRQSKLGLVPWDTQPGRD